MLYGVRFVRFWGQFKIRKDFSRCKAEIGGPAFVRAYDLPRLHKLRCRETNKFFAAVALILSGCRAVFRALGGSLKIVRQPRKKDSIVSKKSCDS